MSREVTIEGKAYRIGRLNPRKQFHVSRRLAPVLLALGRGASQVSEAPNAESESILGVARAFSPIAEALSQMPEADVDYVLTACLSVCELKQGEAYARVQHPNGELMFEDMTMSTMTQLTIQTIQENLGTFFGNPSEG